MTNKVTGIILAGGKSRRMGSDKGLMMFKNKTLVENAIDILKPLCNEIIISSNNDEYKKFGFSVVNDVIKDIGPIGGIYASLLKSKTLYNIVIPCDMPFITTDLLLYMLEFTRESFDVIVPVSEKGLEPLTVVISRNILPTIEEQIESNNLKIKNLYHKSNLKTIEIQQNSPLYKPNLFDNINRPEDYNKILKQ